MRLHDHPMSGNSRRARLAAAELGLPLALVLLVKTYRGLAPDPVEVARGEALIREAGALIHAHLRDREWIAQDRITFADVSLAATLGNAKRLAYPIDDRPHLLAWFERMSARDSWRATAP